jgi:hypothetical protein
MRNFHLLARALYRRSGLQNVPYLAMTLQLAYLVYIPVAMGFGLRVSSRQPYTFAFSIGVGSGIPLMFRVGRKLKARGVKFG